MKAIIKNAKDLTEDEFNQINNASLREFKKALSRIEISSGRIFFLLSDDKKVLAMGNLLPIAPINLNQETFSILGIGGIIANEKGKGYGKEIMTAIRDYLAAKDKTGIGFCMPRNRGFYEKCGFNIDTSSVPRFIYLKGGKRVVDQYGQFIFYHDGSDHFMPKVLSDPDQNVILPIPPTW